MKEVYKKIVNLIHISSFEVWKLIFILQIVRMVSRDRLVVRTLRCGRSNPGSNPAPGKFFF